jgi:hypothetical protein
VWQQSGSNSVRGEILPFWILAFIGLSVSTTAMWIAGSFTDNTLLLMMVNLGAYFFVWVAKYIVMDRMLWGDGASEDAVAVAEAV